MANVSYSRVAGASAAQSELQASVSDLSKSS